MFIKNGNHLIFQVFVELIFDFSSPGTRFPGPHEVNDPTWFPDVVGVGYRGLWYQIRSHTDQRVHDHSNTTRVS